MQLNNGDSHEEVTRPGISVYVLGGEEVEPFISALCFNHKLQPGVFFYFLCRSLITPWQEQIPSVKYELIVFQ